MSPADAFLIGSSALLGLLVGSFLNVVAHRLPRGRRKTDPIQSFQVPASRTVGFGNMNDVQHQRQTILRISATFLRPIRAMGQMADSRLKPTAIRGGVARA